MLPLYKQVPRSPRQNGLPVKLVEGALVMCHQHPTGTLGELPQIGKTSSGTDGVLPHPPETFDGVEVVPTMGGEEMAAHLLAVVGEGRVELVRPVDPTTIDDHHDLFADCAAGRHPLMPILAQLLGITVGHDFIKDFGGTISSTREVRGRIVHW